MLHARTKSISTLAAALPLMALLPGCVMDGADAMASDLASAEQALAASLPLVSPAAATAIATAMTEPAPGVRRHEQPGHDLFALAQGRWVGECDLLVPGQDEPALTVETERIVEPTDNPNEYTWTIIYRGPDFPEQVRPYTILADPDNPGRYVIDEHNGILLASYLLDGNILVSSFQVPNLHLVARDVFRGNKWEFENTATSTTPELSADLGDGFVVDSFRVSSMERCKMRRHGSPH
jgi:hypothetical protein